MNILNFMWGFSDEASCIAYLKEQREQSGVVCRHYGGLKHRWDANKLCFECKHCHSRQSLRSGYHNRAFQASFLLPRWPPCSFLTRTKKSFPTEELRRQWGHKRYQLIWEMTCKSKDVTGKRNNRYQLTSQVELDGRILFYRTF